MTTILVAQAGWVGLVFATCTSAQCSRWQSR